MFYSQDEFDFQVAEQIAAGYTRAEAVQRVERQMREDEREYMIWSDEVEAKYQRDDERGDDMYEDLADRYDREQALYNEFG